MKNRKAVDGIDYESFKISNNLRRLDFYNIIGSKAGPVRFTLLQLHTSNT